MKPRPELYPLQFTPVIKDYLWGGNRLRDVLGKEVSTPTAAESWEVSGVDGNLSVVAEGDLAGRDLQWLIDHYGADMLGKGVLERFGNHFPILIKFIDARKDLSVQLHPDDALAMKRHGGKGKTEMWHIMEADEDATLVIGFNREVSPKEFKEALDSGSLMQLLHLEKVSAGDTFFIKPGTIHAIGKGILLAEIQQTSDITYRVYDYDRVDKDGHKRQLHTELAMDALNFEIEDDFRVTPSAKEEGTDALVECPYFTTDIIHVDGSKEIDLLLRDSFTIYLCVDGSATLRANGATVELKRGQTVLIPAVIPGVVVEGKGAKLLEVHL